MQDQQIEVVMGVFKAFGATTKKSQVVLTLIKRISDHKHSQPMAIGTKICGALSYFPKEGQSFNIENAEIIVKGEDRRRSDLYCTSRITKFLPDNTFETQNSIYKYEILS